MLNLFGGRNCGGEDNSTILWFIILVILLFMNNDDKDSCKQNHCQNDCGC